MVSIQRPTGRVRCVGPVEEGVPDRSRNAHQTGRGRRAGPVEEGGYGSQAVWIQINSFECAHLVHLGIYPSYHRMRS